MKKPLALFLIVGYVLAAPVVDPNDVEDDLDEFDEEFFESLTKTPFDVRDDDIIRPNRSVPGMAGAARKGANLKWSNGVVPYKISHDYDDEERQKIQDAMKELQEKTCIQFKHKNRHHKDVVAFVKGKRCNSYVGKQGGVQVLNLGEDCLSRKTILHELMHALGFIHEHNRPDRDSFVAIKFSNIQEEEKHNFNKWASHEVTLLNTEYAYNSIMHYDGYAFARVGTIPTIVAHQTGAHLGGGERLMEIDALRINRHYCGGDEKVTATVRPSSPPTSPFHWNAQSDGITWAMNCDFYGNDYKTVFTQGAQCGPTCASDPECDHFTWNKHAGGTCWLKKGYQANIAKPSRFVTAVCGYVTYKV